MSKIEPSYGEDACCVQIAIDLGTSLRYDFISANLGHAVSAHVNISGNQNLAQIDEAR